MSKKRKRESKGERAIRKKRARDFALAHGAYGYPYCPS